MKASVLFVKSLEAAGVSHIFGLPGEENLALLDAIRESSIRFIVTRDERTAVFMASTVGRLSGRVGVALSTLGPGATNLVTGVAYAQLGAMPLLVITGQKPIKKSKQGKFQIIDVVGMMRPITKMTTTIISADRIPTTIHQAVRIAELERPGAVHIELPEDIAEEEADAEPIPWAKTRRPVPDQKSIDALVGAVEAATSPVIILGASANRKLVRKQLRGFIDKTGIPFVSTQMGKGVEDESSDKYIGTTALSENDFVHRALEAADLILMVGHDIVEKPPTLKKNHKKFVHINFYPADIDEVYDPDIEVIGDISYSLWAMTEQIKTQTWSFDKMLGFKQAILADIIEKADDSGFPIKPQRIVKVLRDVMPRDGILSLDNGMYKLWVARNYPACEQNSVMLDNALATMGAGLAVGMAAKLIEPDKVVVVLAGDGGFVMNMADIETAKRLKLDMVIIVLTDNGYGMIKWKQQSMGLPDFGLEFSNPDFVRLAESFGVAGHRVNNADEFKTILEKSIDDGGIHIIDVPVDYDENSELTSPKLRDKIKTWEDKTL